MTIKALAALGFCAVIPFGQANAQGFTEDFDNIGTLAGGGWSMLNSSVPVGLQANWFQGTPTTATPTPGPFNAFNGAGNSYIAANFQLTTGNNTISAWLITPNRTFRNGDVVTFYTRKPVPNPTDFADRMQVRMSTNGASTNVGSGSAAVGDFTTLLLDINPTLTGGGAYPYSWTQYTITISGLPAPTSGRIAFRYFVTSGGPTGANSDYIGIDNVVYTPYVCPSFTMTAGGALTGGAAGAAYSTSLTQTGALGTPSYAVTAGALPPGLTLSSSGTISGTPTATGTFNFTATVSDASGCSGAQSYSITVVCPANPTSLTGLPTVCSNAAAVSLTQGAPAGGTYSGTGVTGASFDPAAGTQTITYDYTDAYGCAYATSSTITVNTAPAASHTPLANACNNDGMVALTGGSPAGGTYSGTGVTGTNFDVASGSQTLTYTVTDGNGCSDATTVPIVVNNAPVVTQSPYAAVCSDAGIITLGGSSPAGGTYSGTGVTGSDFDPAMGTQTLNYEYTDANGCSNDVDFTITVNALPVVSQAPITAVCQNSGTVTLSGGAPAGGTYSGTGVTGTSFDPASGTQTLTYTFTDANGCVNDVDFTVTVNPLPTVTQGAIAAVCADNGPVTLSGGAPAGGSYSGTGVTGTTFNPSAGTQTITYSATDANGCTNTASTTITVNPLPTVALSLPVSTMCVYNASVTLTGGSPAGGTFSGTGVSGGSFNPATAGAGTHTVTYAFTDANGCDNTATDNIIVSACLGLDEAAEAIFRVYPNPSAGVFTVSTSGNEGLQHVVITDLQGKVVQNIAAIAGSELLVDLTHAENGIYFLRGEVNGQTVSVRLVKN